MILVGGDQKWGGFFLNFIKKNLGKNICQNFLFQTVKIPCSKLSKFPVPKCQNFLFQTVKISGSKLSKFPVPNCQDFLFQTVKISGSKLSRFPVQNCQNFRFQTVKISGSKLSRFPFPNCQNYRFQTVKISFSKLSKLPVPNCQNFRFQTVKIFPSKLPEYGIISQFFLQNFNHNLRTIPSKSHYYFMVTTIIWHDWISTYIFFHGFYKKKCNICLFDYFGWLSPSLFVGFAMKSSWNPILWLNRSILSVVSAFL
jgi:hypothetical protein